MPTQELTEDSNFEVGEAVWLDIGISAFLFFLFFVVMMQANSEEFSTFAQRTNYSRKGLYVLLIPAVIFLLKAIFNKVSITINKKGFFYYRKKITNWSNFIRAYLDQDTRVGGIQDNFVLVIEYYKPGEDGYFQRRIKLTNTQNKAEEEVLDAVAFFSGKFGSSTDDANKA